MRRDELYVADVVDNTRAIGEYLDAISREQWDQDRVWRDAVVYRLLLLGETASALPDILRDRYPDVAWRQIRAFRNLAVHKYFGVDWAVVWKIAQDEVPLLGEQAMAIMRAEYPDLARTYDPGPVPEPETGPGTAAVPDGCAGPSSALRRPMLVRAARHLRTSAPPPGRSGQPGHPACSSPTVTATAARPDP